MDFQRRDELLGSWNDLMGTVRTTVRTNAGLESLAGNLDIQWNDSSPDKPGDYMGRIEVNGSMLGAILISTSKALSWYKVNPDLEEEASTLLRHSQRPSLLMIELTSAPGRNPNCQIARMQSLDPSRFRPKINFLYDEVPRVVKGNLTTISWVIIMGLLAEQRARPEQFTLLRPGESDGKANWPDATAQSHTMYSQR